MDDNLINALRRVGDERISELSRDEARALLKAGWVQRFDGLLRLTAKGKAVLANTSQAGE